MTDLETARVSAALVKVFGSNKAEAVIAESELYKGQEEYWSERVCFGSFYLEYSLLIMRTRSSEIQVSIELEGSPVACEKAVQSGLEGVLEALNSSDVNLRPSIKALEITPLGDTQPIVTGQTSFQYHLLNSANLQSGIAALTALGAGIAGTFLWADQAAGVWAGAIPSVAIFGLLAVNSTLSARLRKIVWTMVG